MIQFRSLKITLAVCAGCATVTGICAPTVQAQPLQTIWNTGQPPAIRVAIRGLNPWGEPDPRGRIEWVQTVPFYDYCADVLPNEWMPSWGAESLKAGAMAVKMFAWYHHLHPVTIDGFTFEVDNTVNFQTFRYKSGQPETDLAFQEIRSYAYTPPNGAITEMDYRAGQSGSANWSFAKSQKMSQWGSEYLAQTGFTYLQILQFYYPGRQLQTLP